MSEEMRKHIDNFKEWNESKFQKDRLKRNYAEDIIFGNEYYYEYHCFESHKSSDAELWYRSHLKIKVIGLAKEQDFLEDEPSVLIVQFEDGYIGHAWEDEILSSENEYVRPDSPNCKPT